MGVCLCACPSLPYEHHTIRVVHLTSDADILHELAELVSGDTLALPTTVQFGELLHHGKEARESMHTLLRDQIASVGDELQGLKRWFT
jgi:hypothetical protein